MQSNYIDEKAIRNRIHQYISLYGSNKYFRLIMYCKIFKISNLIMTNNQKANRIPTPIKNNVAYEF